MKYLACGLMIYGSMCYSQSNYEVIINTLTMMTIAHQKSLNCQQEMQWRSANIEGRQQKNDCELLIDYIKPGSDFHATAQRFMAIPIEQQTNYPMELARIRSMQSDLLLAIKLWQAR